MLKVFFKGNLAIEYQGIKIAGKQLPVIPVTPILIGKTKSKKKI